MRKLGNSHFTSPVMVFGARRKARLAIPPTTVHNGFQFGEFDLFMSSNLSNAIHFLSEVVFWIRRQQLLG